MKRISAAAVLALEEALRSIYWYKADLCYYLTTALSATSLAAPISLIPPKRQIVHELVAKLAADQDRYGEALLSLMHDTARFDDFSHLERLEDGAEKARAARKAVARLGEMMQTHDEITAGKREARERQRRTRQLLQNQEAITKELDELRKRLTEMVSALSAQRRGFALEKLMYDLFDLFDLDPKRSFRNVGEQIDGAFSQDGTDYLFEARWAGLVSCADLDAFSSKVKRKLDNTLGLFLSMDGFERTGVAAHSVGRPTLLLMTGADLMAVFEGRITFPDLLVQKRRHASQTGTILLQFREM